MHAQDRNNYQKYIRCRAYEIALQLKAEGKIRHFGISFHDKAEILDMILTEHATTGSFSLPPNPDKLEEFSLLV